MFKEGNLLQDKIIVEDSTLKGALVEKGFGESKGRNLILDLYEAIYLTTNEKLVVKAGERKVSAKELIEIGLKGDKTFYSKAIVYEDIKEKGYQIKTGLKFGFDFRIYPKGKKMGQAHSQFGLNVFTENEKISMTQISRITRLAGNIHITAINAVVDRENEINYYSMKRQLF
jgi:tRNA-intron endonuclease, archaea type